MHVARPVTQAKYELLLENKRTTSNVKRMLAASVIIISIIGIACITGYLSWSGMKAGSDRNLFQYSEVPKNGPVMMKMQLKRLDLYGKAFKAMEKSNKSMSEFVTVPNTTVGKTVPSYTMGKVPKLVCYYSLPSGDDLTPEAIDPLLCTHINIASLCVANHTLALPTPAESQVIRQVAALKLHNPSLKVLISVGGFSGPGGFNDMVTSQQTRKDFITKVLTLLLDYTLDGVDLDWEFPAWQGHASERVHFTKLLQELKQQLNERNTGYILSVAVAAPKPIIDEAYDIPEMAKYVDYINLMAYDYHFYVWYLPITGANAPLYARSNEEGYFASLNTNWSTCYWVEKGMPKEKIVVGVPTYGHSFKLVNADNHGWSAPASNIGSLGNNGFVKYHQVCWFLSQSKAKYEFDEDSRVPYAYLGKEWVSYDDDRSVSYKAQYVVNNDYAGVMVFSLNQDDYEGICTGKTFRLTHQVKFVLMDEQMIEMEKSLSIALSIP